MPEIAAAIATMNFLKKPFEDLIATSKAGVKEYFQRWQAQSELEALAKKIEQVGLITTIASRQTSTIDDIYYPARLKQGKGIRVITSADELLSSRERLALIHGTAGQGKSVFLRYLCLRELRLSNKLPLFIELRKIDNDNDLISLIKLHLTTLGFRNDLMDNAIKFMLASGKVRLFLDGFDEIKREHALKIKEQIQSLLNQNTNLQIVLSSRPGALSQYLLDIASLQQHEIAPLAERDYGGFFEKIGVEKDTKERLLIAISRSNAQIRHLLSTPLMLTLLVLTCGMQQDLPDTLPEFYDSLFNLLSSMHDGTKPGYLRQKATALSNPDLEALFRAFSFTSKELVGKVSLTAQQFEQTVTQAIKISEIKCTAEGFRTDVTETVCLMVKEGLDTTFVHKSIQEYYAASFIRHIEDEKLVAAVFSSIETNHIYSWLNEMRFLEDFQHLAYEKYIGIPHAESLLGMLCMSGRKTPTVSITKVTSLIAKLKLRVAITKVTGKISGVYWFLEGSHANSNRYLPDFVQAISKDLRSMTRSVNSTPSLEDIVIFIELSKLITSDAAVKAKVLATCQKMFDAIQLRAHKMKERNLRKGKSLLELMKKRI